MPPHPFCVWNFQFGVGRSLDGNDRLVLETADGADVLIRDVGQRGVWGQGSEQHGKLGSLLYDRPKKTTKETLRWSCV